MSSCRDKRGQYARCSTSGGRRARPGRGRRAAGFTPGPWTTKLISDFISGEDEVVVVSGFYRLWGTSYASGSHDPRREQTVVASVPGGNAEANARLLAAAPELLEALKECVDELESLGWGEAGYTALAKAAINKAAGRK